MGSSPTKLVRGALALTVVSAFILLTPWAVLPPAVGQVRELLDSQLVHLEPQAVLAGKCIAALRAIEGLHEGDRRMLQARGHVSQCSCAGRAYPHAHAMHT